MWWWMGFGIADLQSGAEAYVDAQPGVCWQQRWRSGFWKLSGLSNGTDAPDALGARKEAIARCGLRGDDVLSAVVVAPDTDIGPWEVTIRSSPDAAVGACVARLLEAVPWDREHPGSTMVLAFRTTGAAVAAWSPPEEEPVSHCQRARGWNSLGGQGLGPRWNERFVCAADEPLARLWFSFEPGRPDSLQVKTTPPVPCVEARVREALASVSADLQQFRVLADGTGPIRCSFDLALEAP